MRTAILCALLTAALVPAFAEDKPATPPTPATDVKPTPAPETKPAAPPAAAPAAAAKPAANAKVEWHECDIRDVPAAVKKALIDECDKLSGDNDVRGFKYFQTGVEAKDQEFKAEFIAGDKRYVVRCSATGEIQGSDSKPGPKVVAPPADPAAAPKP